MAPDAKLPDWNYTINHTKSDLICYSHHTADGVRSCWFFTSIFHQEAYTRPLRPDPLTS